MEFQPPKTCKTLGIPSVPQELVDTVGHYVNARSASFLAWHPKEESMLIRTRFASSHQVHRVDMPLGARKQLTFFEDAVGSAASFDPPTGDFFIYSRDVGGNQKYQLYRYDMRDGFITLLTDGKNSKNEGVTWSNCGRFIAYISTARNGTDRDIWIMDPRNPTETNKLLLQGCASDGVLCGIDWSPDGSTLLLTRYVSVSEQHLLLFHIATRDIVRLFQKPGVCYCNGHFNAAGNGAVCLTNDECEFMHLVSFPLDISSRSAGPTTVVCEGECGDIDGLCMSPDRKKLAVTVNDKCRSRMYVLNTDTFSMVEMVGFPCGVVTLYRGGWHRKGLKFAYSVNHAQSATDVYSCTPSCKTSWAERWTEGELGQGIFTHQLQLAQGIEWTSFDGLRISGFLFCAFVNARRSRERMPVIIKIHGGPESHAGPTFQGRYNYYINELGCAMLYPNVRGSTGFGKTFVTLDDGKLREDSVRDIGALLDWIASPTGGQVLGLDSERVCIMGGSYGGYMSLACAVHYSDRVKCFVDVVGISNIVTFLENTESYRRDWRRLEYGDERDPEMRQFLLDISPLTHVDRMTKPIFIVQGANDPRVPVTEALQMVASLQASGRHVWYLEGTNEGHGFSHKDNADYEFFCTCMFIRTFLLQ